MTTLNSEGMFVSPSIRHRRFHTIEHGKLDAIKAIVLHQTDSSTAEATFNAYQSGSNGAHFLIDTDGRIYQTASAHKRCYHVGRLIKSRCLEIKPFSCADAELAKAKALRWAARVKEIDKIERTKKYPDRFPVNSDSLGIELVGRHINDTTYEAVSSTQSSSLRWLLNLLYQTFTIGSDDTFRHPQVSYKNPGEAASAKW
ncbi:peptidoglycan recognition protein family protein [Thauera sp. ZXT1-4]|uniref:peptidoglycan recognition protein family protein n=1 Tax=Thauera sp. ZXT1-4 TaxID=3460294 RepID=UPI004040B5D3